MKIALTGSTGFIGSHFTNQALSAGHSILAIRRSQASAPRIRLDQQPQWLDRALDDVTVEDLNGCDVLVHLAAHTANAPYDTLANCLRWNLMAVLTLFERARLAGLHRYVVAGTCFEYGHSGERYEAIPTTAPLEPTNTYAASKAAASIALCQWAQEHGLSLDLLRVFHVFGEGEAETRFWPALRRAALAGVDFPMTAAEQIRDFLPVEAVASTFLHKAAECTQTIEKYRVFNLSSGNPCSLRAFAESWWRTWNAQGDLLFGLLPYRPGEIMQYVPGPQLLQVASSDALL